MSVLGIDAEFNMLNAPLITHSSIPAQAAIPVSISAPQPAPARTSTQRRLLIRFDNPDMFDDAESFEADKSAEPLEYQKPRQRIPVVKSDKHAKEQMLYYVQYVLQQFKQASNLFSSFHVNGDDITIVFDCPNGFSIAYDVRLYCAGDWMLSDSNISRSYHFATWGAIDFAVLDMLKNAREIITSTFKQPLNESNWPDKKGVLVFVDPPKNSRRESERSASSEAEAPKMHRRKHSKQDSSESEDSDSSSSDSEDDRRKSRKKSSKAASSKGSARRK